MSEKRKLGLGIGALVGTFLTASLMGIMFLARQAAGLSFVPYEVFNWVARELPGGLVTFGIDLMIDTMRILGISVADTAKTAERIMAIIQFLLAGSLAGALFFAVARIRRAKATISSGLIIGAIFGLPTIAIVLTISQSTVSWPINALWLTGLFLAWGIALSLVYKRLEAIKASAETVPAAQGVPAEQDVSFAKGVLTAASVEKINRRQFLIRLGAATATITVVGSGLGSILATAERRRQAQLTTNTLVQAVPTSVPTYEPSGSVIAVSGTRPEITPIEDHYKVFLQTEPTFIDGESWRLPITGLVDNPLMLTIDDIRNNYEPRDQYVTLTCISGRVGTGLIGTTLWTGVSVQEVLTSAGLQDEARYLIITSGDGFHETVDLDLIANDERIMFCYAWDGQPLPFDHGFPLRIWIPDRYGMKQPKWITEIEVVDEYQEGYWVKRNWDGVARVKATSVIDTVAVEQVSGNGGEELVLVGGIAYAGARGISKVEVRVDDGPWGTAQLRDPLSDSTWVVWRYEWPFSKGNHTFEVRCVEADGTPQIEKNSGARPDGSSGIHSLKAKV